MNKGVILGLGLLGLLALSSSSPAAPAPPGPPPPPPPPPPPGPDPATDSGFFNWATNAPSGGPGFLNWGPGQGGAPARPAPAVTLPKAGERWQATWSVNRHLAFYETGAAATAFRSQMTDQTLETLVQSPTAPWTVTVTSVFKTDATAPIPLGQVIRKSDVVATLTGARRVT